MSIVRQTDKRCGITYVYESISWWDKEKKQSRSRRKLIGKIDPGTDEVIPTRKQKREPTLLPSGYVSCGATLLLDEIARATGVREDLEACFPDSYREMLSLAYFVTMENHDSLGRFSRWSLTHKTPFGNDIYADRGNGLLTEVDEVSRYDFFALQSKRRNERKVFFHEVRAVASYSCGIAHKPYSDYKNYEYPDLLHFGVLIGGESQLPLYYTQLPIASMDTKVLNGLIADWKAIASGKLSFVIDRDFYDERHINYMLDSHIKFLMVVKTTVPFVQRTLGQMRDEVRRVSNFRSDCRYYGCSKTLVWEDTLKRETEPAPGGKKRKLYLHLYYSDEKAMDDERAFYSQINAWKKEIESGNRIEANERAYALYFSEVKTKNRKQRAMANLREIEKVRKDFGYSAMISNTIKDPFAAMKTHLKVTLAENSFENLKDRFTYENSLIRKNRNFEGAMFVEFIAFILMSYLKNKIEASPRLVRHTMQELLDQLDFIECCERDGKYFRVGELTQRQLDIYEAFSVDPPGLVLG
ncbi:MAG: hypothetical protein LBK04_01130 [Clostridiales Family XIII bacterium]|jgi:hypothetical protein|nr:hypothetical protein [Clostridiales Family XIII bacterium]